MGLGDTPISKTFALVILGPEFDSPKPTRKAQMCNPTTMEAESGRFLELTSQGAQLSSELQDNERPCLRTHSAWRGGMHLKSNIQGPKTVISQVRNY